MFSSALNKNNNKQYTTRLDSIGECKDFVLSIYHWSNDTPAWAKF